MATLGLLAARRAPSRTRAGWTLVEVLVASAIVCILAAIAMPVVVQAKQNGHRATSISNLRQCGIALILYTEDYEGLASMPLRPTADEVLRQAPTCDPGDYLRKGCNAASTAPFIGSYAYVRDKEVYATDESWTFYQAAHANAGFSPGLLINLFVSSKRHNRSLWFGPYPLTNPHPDRIQVFEADGGVRLYKPRSRPDIGYTWHTLFLKR